jgi:Protein of unknown function (DUF2637)
MPCGVNEQHQHPEPGPGLTPEQQRERAAAVGGYLLLAFVGLCVALMSWKGLVDFGEDILGLGEWAAKMVPISLDGAAIALAFLGLRSVLAGDAAGFPRVLAVVVIGASAGFNFYQASRQYGDAAAELFFAGMTVLVYLLFEVVLRQIRRRSLRAIGAIEAPLPRFRLARWLPGVAFRETLRAWKMAVRHGVTSPAEALELARTPDEDRTIDRTPVRGALERVDTADKGRTEDRTETLTPADGIRDADLQPDSGRTELALVDSQADRVRQAKAILLERPDVKGPELGELVGVGRSRGYELLRLAKNGDGL